MQKIFIGALLKVGYFRSLIIYGWHVYIGHSKISPTICSALHLHMVWSFKEWHIKEKLMFTDKLGIISALYKKKEICRVMNRHGRETERGLHCVATSNSCSPKWHVSFLLEALYGCLSFSYLRSLSVCIHNTAWTGLSKMTC